MITIPSLAIFPLQSAVIIQLARWLEIHNSLGEDDDWPEGYDTNDIPIYMDILKELMKSDYKTDFEYILPNKFLWFMIMLIPEYVEKNMKNLSYETYMAVKKVYSDAGGWLNIQLPDWTA